MFNSSLEMSWILSGDFNNVLSSEEKANGLPITMYEIRDFKNCCYDIGISNMRSTRTFHTWSNNSVWCKLDRAMFNTKWVQEGHIAQANFDFQENYQTILPVLSPCLGKMTEEQTRLNYLTHGLSMRNSWK